MKSNKINWGVLIVMLLLSVNMQAVVAASAGQNSPSVIVRATHQAKEVKSISKDYTKISCQGAEYYYSKGRYYVPSDGGYTVVVPSAGIEQKKLPSGYSPMSFLNRKLYSCHGVIYEKREDGVYRVVLPEVGMSVSDLPESQIREISYGGVQYYEVAGYVYKSVSDGEEYVVVCAFDSLGA